MRFPLSRRLLAVAFLFAMRPVAADDRPPDDPAAVDKMIRADLRRQFSDFSAAESRAKTADERKAAAAKLPDRVAFAARFVRLADIAPDTVVELNALVWAALNAPDSEPGRTAVARLLGGRIDRATPSELAVAFDSTRTRFVRPPAHRTLAPAVLARVKRSPDDQKAAKLLADVCVVYADDESETPPAVFRTAADLIAARFADSPDVSHFAETFWINTPPWAGHFEPHLRKLVEKNRTPIVRATSRYALAAVVRSSGVDRQAEAERLFRQFVAEYDGKTEQHGVEDTLLSDARREIAQIERCGLGKPAQEIAGEDLNGTPFKLSEYRGKVVLLVFWASWCGPCLADVPHEKELVEKFNGRPFALIGVNGDAKKEEGQKAVVRAGIPWRSVWNGPAVASGPIARAWAVGGWPTVYVIDHDGVIRHDRLRGKRLDGPLETLVARAEAAAKADKR